MSQRFCFLKMLVVAGLVAVCASGASASIIIDTVPVGNVGNAADTRYATPGYGGVGYAFNMGKYEVTAGQYTAFLNAVAATDTYGLYNTTMANTAWGAWGCNIQRSGSSGSYTYSVAADWANRPVNWVSWGDSARFANWLRNGQPTGPQGLGTTEDGSYFLNGATSDAALMAVTREADATWVIPSEDEWHKAAYHMNDGVTGNYWVYPTGTNYLPNNELINPDPGNNATYYDYWDYTIGSPYWRTEVGDHENSESPYGTFDQGGNVFEWTDTAILGWAWFRGLRGGSWFNYGDDNFMEAWNAPAQIPTFEHMDYGFRLSEVPEPATLALLAFGIMEMLTRRRGLGM